MTSGDRLSPLVLAQEAVVFSDTAKQILADAEYIAMRYPPDNGIIGVLVAPRFRISLDPDNTSVRLYQMYLDNPNRQLPELPALFGVELSSPSFMDPSGQKTLDPGNNKVYSIQISYRNEEAAEVAKNELRERLTLGRGSILFAYLRYCFSGSIFEKDVRFDGIDDFTDPSLLIRAKSCKLTTFRQKDLPIRPGEAELIGFAMQVIRQRLTEHF